jgi:hypothetical protein
MSIFSFSYDLDKFDDVVDTLGRNSLARTIARELHDCNSCPDGRVLGLYGSWGAGKSHVLAQVIKHCIDQNAIDDVYIVPCIFKAWRYETEGDLAPGLIRSLIQLPQHPEIKSKLSLFDDDKLLEETKKIAKELLSIVLDLSLATVPAGQVVSGALQRLGKRISESSVDALQKQPDDDDAKIDEVQKKMKKLVDSILQQAKQKYPDKRPRLVIFIDDLDRCSPKNMVRLFEWLKNHLLVDNCVYVLALDHVAAARAIVGEYKNYLEDDKDLAYGLRYLEKLIDSEYELGQSKKLEYMAIQALYEESAPYRQCDDLKILAERIEGTQFAGSDLIPALMSMQCLRTPRTTLKIIAKFTRIIEEFKSPQWSDERNSLPAYPFWILFMTSMYYRLEPEQFTRFVAGELSIYNLMRGENTKTRTGAENSSLFGPLADFEQFALNFRTKTGGNVPVPLTEQRQLLARLVHEN